jgi:hypothetical protein
LTRDIFSNFRIFQFSFFIIVKSVNFFPLLESSMYNEFKNRKKFFFLNLHHHRKIFDFSTRKNMPTLFINHGECNGKEKFHKSRKKNFVSWEMYAWIHMTENFFMVLRANLMYTLSGTCRVL